MEGFKITDHKGFHITFANEVTVSVQFGPGNYCDNRNMSYDEPREKTTLKSQTAEIAIYESNGTWLTRFCPVIENKGDDVSGWVKPDCVLASLLWAQSLNKNNIKAYKKAYKNLEE